MSGHRGDKKLCMEVLGMKYQVGKTGRVVVARFEDKEDVLGNLSSIAKRGYKRCCILSGRRHA